MSSFSGSVSWVAVVEQLPPKMVRVRAPLCTTILRCDFSATRQAGVRVPSTCGVGGFVIKTRPVEKD